MNELVGFNPDNFDKLFSIVQQTAQNAQIISESVIGIKKDFEAFKIDVRGDISTLKEDIEGIKNNYEISNEQRKQIRRAVNSQVRKLLDLPDKKGNLTLEDRVKIQKYGHIFHQRCYAEVSRIGHLGNPYGVTVKKDFISAIKDIEAWTPSNGISGLMKEADDNAEARKIAKEQGYL